MPTYANPFQSSAGPGPFSPTDDDQMFYYNQVPEAGYWAWLYNQNQNNWGTGSEARYAQNQFGRYRNQFTAEAAQDPFMEWYPWLNKQRSVNDDYALQGPDSRGESNYRMYTPRSRWVMPGGG